MGNLLFASSVLYKAAIWGVLVDELSESVHDLE